MRPMPRNEILFAFDVMQPALRLGLAPPDDLKSPCCAPQRGIADQAVNRGDDQRPEQQHQRTAVISVATRPLDQKIVSDPFDMIIDCRNASSALSPITIASTNGAIG